MSFFIRFKIKMFIVNILKLIFKRHIIMKIDIEILKNGLLTLMAVKNLSIFIIKKKKKIMCRFVTL